MAGLTVFVSFFSLKTFSFVRTHCPPPGKRHPTGLSASRPGFRFPLDECYHPLPKSRSLDVDGERRWQRGKMGETGRGKETQSEVFETGKGLLLLSHGLDPAETPSIPIMAFPLPITRDVVRAHLPV